MITKEFKTLLWECDLRQLDRSDNIVIERIFQYWDVNHIKTLLKHTKPNKLKTKIEAIRNRFDSKTQQFIKVLLPINLQHKSKKDDNKRLQNIPTRNIG